MDGDIGTWARSIPIVTRYWFFSFLILPLTTRLNLIYWPNLLLDWNKLVYSFQIWRLATALLWYPVNFHWLMLLYFLYSYSRLLEEGHFVGRPADFLFMLLFNAVCINIAALLFSMFITSPALVFSVLYVFCQINKDTLTRFWFGIEVKAMYLPWVLFLFFFVLQADWQSMLLGIVVGHFYFFLMFKYPQDFNGPQLLSTPQILYQWLPNERTYGGFGSAPRQRRGGDANREPRQHAWGQGQRLGD